MHGGGARGDPLRSGHSWRGKMAKRSRLVGAVGVLLGRDCVVHRLVTALWGQRRVTVPI